MTDQQDGALVVAHQLFQQFEGLDVEVVGRFVQHQQVGRFGKQLGQQQPVAFTTGQGADGGVGAFRAEQEILQVAHDVFLLAVDGHGIPAAADVVAHIHVFVELGAQLVEVRDLHVGAHGDLAAVGLALAEQGLDQGGFADAVGADDTDTITPQDDGGKVLHDGAAIEGHIDVFGLDDLLAAGLCLLDRGLDVALAFAALGPFLAHGFECAHPAFVASATGLDALANPDFFLGQFLVEAFPFQRFGVEDFFLAAQVIFVVAGPVGEFAAIQVDDAGGQLFQKRAIVGDEQHCVAVLQQEFFQPADGFDVQVVGRFVQQQDIGFLHQGACQQDAAFDSAGLGQKFGVAIQIELGQDGVHPLLQLPAVLGFQLLLHLFHLGEGFVIAVGHCFQQMMVFLEQVAYIAKSRCHHIEYAAAGVLGHFLFQPGDLGARCHFHDAVVGLDLATDDLEQRGFAGAVTAHQTDALALVEGEGGTGQQFRATKGQVKVAQANE